MAMQTEVEAGLDIEPPTKIDLVGSVGDAEISSPPAAAERASLKAAPPLEPMRTNDPDQAPEGATVFTTPNVRNVRDKLFSTYFAVFTAGLNDAAFGTLIPFLLPAYDVGLLQIAIVYLINFVGWLIAAFTNVHVTSRIGQGGVLVFGGLCQVLAFSLMLWKPPFPLFAASFFLTGLGAAYQDAQANTFAANVENAYFWLGMLHAAYGLGVLIAPLIATTIAARTPHWNYYYCVMLGVAAINVALLGYTFRHALFRPASKEARETAGTELKQALRRKEVWILSAFFLLYVGAETTAGGWVVQFLVTIRGGNAGQVGYVASGFWGGLTLGRVLLSGVVNRFGERGTILFSIACALGMQFLFWFVPNIIADAVFISFLGFCIAQFFPVGISVLTKLLPRELHVAAVGFVATTGQAGSAAFPFLTGAIASARGVQVLQPIMVALLAGMFILWPLLPKVKKPIQ